MSPEPRQRVERLPGARRARLTAAPGAQPEAAGHDEETDAEASVSRVDGPGPNDERLRQDVPPHY